MNNIPEFCNDGGILSEAGISMAIKSSVLPL